MKIESRPDPITAENEPWYAEQVAPVGQTVTASRLAGKQNDASKNGSPQLLAVIATARAWRAIMRFSFVGTT